MKLLKLALALAVLLSAKAHGEEAPLLREGIYCPSTFTNYEKLRVTILQDTTPVKYTIANAEARFTATCDVDISSDRYCSGMYWYGITSHRSGSARHVITIQNETSFRNDISTSPYDANAILRDARSLTYFWRGTDAGLSCFQPH